MRFEGAIFDLDGTLTDSMYIWDETPVALIKELGGNPPADLSRDIKEMGRREAADYLIQRFHLERTPEEIMAHINRLVDVEYSQIVPAKEGVKTLLARLNARNIPCCIATASEARQAQAAMERLDLWQYFSFAISCMEHGSKSSPHIYLEGAKRMNADPKHTLVFEDALHAVRTAAAAGFPVVGVYDPSAQEDQGEIKALSRYYLNALDDPFFLSQLQ